MARRSPSIATLLKRSSSPSDRTARLPPDACRAGCVPRSGSRSSWPRFRREKPRDPDRVSVARRRLHDVARPGAASFFSRSPQGATSPTQRNVRHAPAEFRLSRRHQLSEIDVRTFVQLRQEPSGIGLPRFSPSPLRERSRLPVLAMLFLDAANPRRRDVKSQRHALRSLARVTSRQNLATKLLRVSFHSNHRASGRYAA